MAQRYGTTKKDRELQLRDSWVERHNQRPTIARTARVIDILANPRLTDKEAVEQALKVSHE